MELEDLLLKANQDHNCDCSVCEEPDLCLYTATVKWMLFGTSIMFFCLVFFAFLLFGSLPMNVTAFNWGKGGVSINQNNQHVQFWCHGLHVCFK